MDNVVSFVDFRAKKDAEKSLETPAEDTLLFEAHVHSRGPNDEHYPAYFHIPEHLRGGNPGEKLREMADQLEDVVLALRMTAQTIDPIEDGDVLANITVYSSSKVSTHLSRRLNDRDWLARRFTQVLEQNFADCQQRDLQSPAG